jgi:hypothetical protein
MLKCPQAVLVTASLGEAQNTSDAEVLLLGADRFAQLLG